MDFGVLMFPTEYAIPIDRLAELLEDRGIESLWVPEHPAIPVDRHTPFPGGEPLPEQYWHALDPFIALAYAAHATKRLKLGTGICLVSERDPIQLAKSVASLDLLSGGRVQFGIGAGWLGEEMEVFGTPYAKRWAVTRERVLAMTRLWTEAEPEYHGSHVDFPPLKVFPKPIQKPYPPILIGAGSRWARQRVVDWADGWFPNCLSPEWMVKGIDDLRRRAAEKGRDMSTISINAFQIPRDATAIRSLARAGVNRGVFHFPSVPESAMLANLDAIVQVIRDSRAA